MLHLTGNIRSIMSYVDSVKLGPIEPVGESGDGSVAWQRVVRIGTMTAVLENVPCLLRAVCLAAVGTPVEGLAAVGVRCSVSSVITPLSLPPLSSTTWLVTNRGAAMATGPPAGAPRSGA